MHDLKHSNCSQYHRWHPVSLRSGFSVHGTGFYLRRFRGSGSGYLSDQGKIMLSRIAPVLALIGIPMSIWDLGVYGDLWALLFCWFCLAILFWWYLANVVFRPASKRERRNLAYRKVVKRKNDHKSNNR